MDINAIDKLLGQLRAGAAMAGQSVGGVGAASAAGAAGAPVAGNDFAKVLKSSIDGVNARQVEATGLQRDFELGVPNTNLTDVMISMQKANLSFQQMVQVRNRLVSAYHDIMNMQV
ncbi:MAG: flagellar hook-basal body complex protein FliE [Comamonadaceae bacterium]|nr:MAG: flagellar hook-basal body complex protein FliE [Comamonadaceae bacterium]